MSSEDKQAECGCVMQLAKVKVRKNRRSLCRLIWLMRDLEKLRWKKYQRMLNPAREPSRKILERWRQTRCSSDDHAYRLKLGKCKGVAVLASCYRQFTACKITCQQGTPPPTLANEYQPISKNKFFGKSMSMTMLSLL